MIRLSNLTLQRGPQRLLEGAEMTLHTGHKAGLIGANGAGKSSLFALLRGELSPDAGDCQLPGDWRIAHMRQEVDTLDRLAVDYVLDGDVRLRKVQAELAAAEQAHDGTALARLHIELDSADGYTADARARKLLAGLGFTNEQMDRRVGDFSGGWRMRLNLAQALMCPSDLLLLDEPTNHLDLDAILWLEDWLKGYPGTLLLISHDRDFLDAVVDHVLHVEQRKLNLYKGGYTAFERTRAERLAQQQQAYEKQQAQRAHMEKYIARFKAQATKARQAQSRIKALERMEELSAAHVDSPFDFVFRESQKISSPLLSLSEGRLGYGDKAILDKVKLQLTPGARIGLLGPNGAGKSTLIKNLAGELEPLSGRLVRGENLAVGYFAQHQLDSLDDKASPLLHLQRIAPTEREQTLRDFLGGFDFHGDRVDEPVVNFSGGEKARLALGLLVGLVRVDRGGTGRRAALAILDQPAAVVVQVTIEDVDLAVGHQQELVGGALEQVTVVRHHHHGTGKLLQGHGQRQAHFQVEVVGRFVEQQQVWPFPGDQRQRQTGLFATREVHDRLVATSAVEVETAQEVAQGLLTLSGRDALQVQQRAGLVVQRVELVLGEVANGQVFAPYQSARQRFQFTRKVLD